jgi:thymidylate synthase ThyX
MIKADILLDSINPSGNRITTWLLTFQRVLLAEINTHRMFSRNTSSSRAIPVHKMLEAVKTNPAMPVFWGKNQAGMSAAEELMGEEKELAKRVWLKARDSAVSHVEKLLELGLHKNLTNRLLESWMWTTSIVTATDMENFFSLRAHSAAQPEFQTLAFLMLEKYNASVPTRLATGEWHIPFGDRMPEGLTLNQKLKIATARCARTSYLTFDGDINVEKDYGLHDQLAKSGHWSPFEHCAKAHWSGEVSGNFRGWIQYRKEFRDENRNDNRVISKS